MAKIELIKFDAHGAYIPQLGINAAQMEALKPRLMAARDEVLIADLKLYESTSEIPAEKQPLDAGFHWKCRNEFSTRTSPIAPTVNWAGSLIRRRSCETSRQSRRAGNWRFVHGCPGVDGNVLPTVLQRVLPAERGGRPRMYFEGNNVDNDWSQGLLHFLRTDSANDDGPEGKWGIVVISKSGGTLETAAAFRQFLAALEKLVGREQFAGLCDSGHWRNRETGRPGRCDRLSRSLHRSRWRRADGFPCCRRSACYPLHSRHRCRDIAGRSGGDEFAFSYGTDR